MSSPGYYDLAEHGDDELTQAFDGYENLPDAGHNDALDTFCASKNIDIPALVRLGARLSAPTVLAYGFPGGIKYRNMEHGQRWTGPGSFFSKLKIIRAGAKAAPVVIIAEGETDAARLTMLYDVDVAVLPAGAGRFTQEFADQLATYERVLVGTDNDGAGEAGFEKIAAFIRHAERFAPPAGDWCATPPDQDPPPIPEAPERLPHIGALELIDLGPAFRGEIPPPEMLVEDLLYDEGVHFYSGHPGAGKSLLAMSVCQLAMIEGAHVIWLDYEMGPRATGARLREFGVPEEHLALFHYAWSPGDATVHLQAIAAAYPRAIIVIDSASKALSAAGIDENSAMEVTAWTRKLIEVAKVQRSPIIVVDHVSKSSTGPYGRGSGAKFADTDVQLMVKKLEHFDRTTIGIVEVTNHKDREAYIPQRMHFLVGDGNGGLQLQPCDPPSDEDDAAEPSL